MHLSILDTRPFNKFVEMELERDNLYHSFTTLDEPKEISKAWVTFAESCSQKLSVMNNLADMAVERVFDVYQDVLVGKDNSLPLHSLLYGDLSKQLLALNQFELQLGVMTYVYSQVRNRGVFSFEPKTKQYLYYVTSKEALDKILYRILNNEIPETKEENHTPSPKIQDLLDVLLPLVQLENLKRLIPIYDNLLGEEKKPQVLAKKGEYDYLQGITLLTHIIGIARKAGQDFWWSDPISELSILNHAKEHFESVINLWTEGPETLGSRAHSIQQEFLPIVDAQSSISLVQHFRLLAFSALESGDLNHAKNYFAEAIKEFKKACKSLKEADTTQGKVILQSIKNKEVELKILHSLTNLAIQYNNVVEALYGQNTEEAVKHCLEITQSLEDIESSGVFPYLYGVSVIYSSTSTIITELLEKDISNLSIIDRLISQFNFHLKAMDSALSEIDLEFLRVNDKEPYMSYNALTEIDEKLSHLEKAIELLPTFIPEKERKRHSIYAMRFYVKSLLAENKIYRYADNNIVLDLILRARAHYFAKKAEQQIGNIKKVDKVLKKLITERMIETKNSGMVTESSLILLGLQTNYKKQVRGFFEEIIPLLEQSEEVPDFIADSTNSAFDSMTDFQEMLDLMKIDTDELLSTKK
ncbi:MAG: hypothetical protein ACTSP3_13910, partial [Candidatus Heimdallarchaeaceae archaeon]